jgi:hypothetical protein
MSAPELSVIALVEQEDGYEMPLWIVMVRSVIERLPPLNPELPRDFQVRWIRDLAGERQGVARGLTRQLGDGSLPRRGVFLASPFHRSLKDHLALAREIKTVSPESLILYGGKIATLQTQTAGGLTGLRAPWLRAAVHLLTRGQFGRAWRVLIGRRPLIDLVVRGDAEMVFEQVMRGIQVSLGAGDGFRRRLSSEWLRIRRGLAYVDPATGATHLQPPGPAPTGGDLERIYGGLRPATVDADRTALLFGGQRTCPFRCVFCLEHSTSGPADREEGTMCERSMGNLAVELDRRLGAGQRRLLMVDALWHGHSQAWKEGFVRFFETRAAEYPEVTLKIFGHVKWVARDFGLLQRLAQVCRLSYFLGIENINQQILDKLRKRISVGEIHDALARLRHLKAQRGTGVSVVWGYIMVTPWDSFASISASSDFLHEQGMMSSIVLWSNSLGLYPTGPMLQALDGDGLLLRDDRFGPDWSLQHLIHPEDGPLARYACGQLVPPDARRPFDSDLYRLAGFLSRVHGAQMKSETQRLLHRVAEEESQRTQYESLLADLNRHNYSMFRLFLAEAERNWRFLTRPAWRSRSRFLETLYVGETEAQFRSRLEALIRTGV